MAERSKGQIIIGGTPIGNIADTSVRFRQICQNVDVIAAEDTRVIRKLLKKLDIKLDSHVVLESFYDHNEKEKTSKILELAQDGKSVLLVSDAGMPTISDPGYSLINEAHEKNINVTSVPGPSALTTALALSGLPTNKFTFEGFIARKESEKKTDFENLRYEKRTMVFFESPHRLKQTLETMKDIFGFDRRAAVARELTKLFEEIKQARLEDLVLWSKDRNFKGEIVLVLEGQTAAEQEIIRPSEQEMVKEILDFNYQGKKLKDAAGILAQRYGQSKNDLYNLALKARNS